MNAKCLQCAHSLSVPPNHTVRVVRDTVGNWFARLKCNACVSRQDRYGGGAWVLVQAAFAEVER